METSKTCSRIHDEIHEYPALRIKDFVDRKVSRIALVNCDHYLFRNSLESIGTAIILINNSGSRLFADADILVAESLFVVPDQFALMVIECKTYSGIKRKICRDVILGNVDLTVLNILSMNKLYLIDHIKFFEKHSADESVKIASGNKSFLIHKADPPFYFQGAKTEFSRLYTKNYFTRIQGKIQLIQRFQAHQKAFALLYLCLD